MKVLHMIFEGYTPSSGNLVQFGGWYGFRKRSLLSGILPKHERWSKIYCDKLSLNILNSKDAIWNRLAEQNISSFNIIHRLFIDSEFCINQYPDKAQVISFHLLDFLDVKVRRAIWQGTHKVIALPDYKEFSDFYNMSSINDVVNMIYSNLIGEVVRGDLEHSEAAKAIKTVLDGICDCASPLVKESMAKGIQIYSRLLDDYHDEQYVSVAIPESESMYLFCEPYIELQNEYKKYFQTILDMFMAKVNPDIVFIHGTQEMKSIADSENKNKIIFDYNGETFKAIRLESQLIYTEPDTHASLNVYIKDASLYKMLDRYFAEFCYIKGTVHEKMYKFVTEKFKEL